MTPINSQIKEIIISSTSILVSIDVDKDVWRYVFSLYDFLIVDLFTCHHV